MKIVSLVLPILIAGSVSNMKRCLDVNVVFDNITKCTLELTENNGSWNITFKVLPGHTILNESCCELLAVVKFREEERQYSCSAITQASEDNIMVTKTNRTCSAQAVTLDTFGSQRTTTSVTTNATAVQISSAKVVTSDTSGSQLRTDKIKSNTTVTVVHGLSSLVALLAMIIVVLAAGWSISCWCLIKKRQRMTVISKLDSKQTTLGDKQVHLVHCNRYGERSSNSNTAAEREYDVIQPLPNQPTESTDKQNTRSSHKVPTSHNQTAEMTRAPATQAQEKHFYDIIEEEPASRSKFEKDLQISARISQQTAEPELKAGKEDKKVAEYEVPIQLSRV